MAFTDVGPRGFQPVLDAAARHGRESDPDHEVGDLQDAFRAAWIAMTPHQRKKVLYECEHVAEWAEDAWLDDEDEDENDG